MISRRNLLFGTAYIGAAGAAYWLKPRHTVSVLKGRQLGDLVPTTFGTWTSQDVSDPLALNADSLAGKLYNQLVTRTYLDNTNGNQVLLLFAHGEKQTDELQLHRPEICYPAFGYTLVRNEPDLIPLKNGKTIPARRILAQIEDRKEAVIYWSRIGEFLPASASEQRKVRFENSMHGLVPDGLLCRFSAIADNPEQAWRFLGGFAAELIAAMRADQRNVLIGSDRAA